MSSMFVLRGRTDNLIFKNMFLKPTLSKRRSSIIVRFFINTNVLFTACSLTQNAVFQVDGVSDATVATITAREVMDIQVYQLPRLHVVRHIRLVIRHLVLVGSFSVLREDHDQNNDVCFAAKKHVLQPGCIWICRESCRL